MARRKGGKRGIDGGLGFGLHGEVREAMSSASKEARGKEERKSTDRLTAVHREIMTRGKCSGNENSRGGFPNDSDSCIARAIDLIQLVAIL